MNPQNHRLLLFILTLGLLFSSCSIFSTSEDILAEQRGTLYWGGLPAADGVGILFETEDETYGAPGTREDYTDYFPEDENQVEIIADIEITGDTTVRGWGTEFPEIRFLEIQRIE